jgi:ATP-dependent DNA helicase RecQ
MVDLSWVGRQAAIHPVHRALAKIQTGDPVQLTENNGRWEVRTSDGVTVGRMAQGYRPLDGSFVRGEVSAIIRWRKFDNAEEFRGTLRREAWEVVLPELVFRH